MSRAWWPVVSGTVLLAVLLTVLFLRTLAPRAAQHDAAAMHEALQRFELHDAELSRDVLLARAGLLPNYDALAVDRRNIEADLESLTGLKELIAGSPPPTRALLGPMHEALLAAADAKLLAVEDFKSANAILRNSLAYLTKEGPAQRAELLREVLPEDFGRLSFAILRYMQAPDDEVGREIDGLLEHLRTRVVLAPEFGTFVNHAAKLRQMLPEVDADGADVRAAPTDRDARVLEKAVLDYAAEVERRTQPFRYALYLASLLLLGYLLYQYTRLRASAVALDATNDSLRREKLALEASEARFRAVTDSAREAIVSVDDAGTIVFWNRGAAAMFGYPAEAVLGTPVASLEPEGERARDVPGIAERLRDATGSPHIECTGRRSDGSAFPLDVSLSPWAGNDGRYVTAIMRDLTMRKALEEKNRQSELQLIQASRMSTLGTLVESVAHEINKPIHAIAFAADNLVNIWSGMVRILDAHAARHPGTMLGSFDYVGEREHLVQIPHDIQDSAQRIRQTVLELRDFGQAPAAGSLEDFDLNLVVSRAVRLVAWQVEKSTRHFTLALAPGLPAAHGDAHKFWHVVVNLLSNALEALPDRSRGVTLSTAFDAQRRRVELVVADEGVGVPESDLHRLTEPFFTTKARSGGTGLGLAITASLVRAQRGELRFESRLGFGTQAIVTLAAGGAARAESGEGRSA